MFSSTLEYSFSAFRRSQILQSSLVQNEKHVVWQLKFQVIYVMMCSNIKQMYQYIYQGFVWAALYPGQYCLSFIIKLLMKRWRGNCCRSNFTPGNQSVRQQEAQEWLVRLRHEMNSVKWNILWQFIPGRMICLCEQPLILHHSQKTLVWLTVRGTIVITMWKFLP